MPRVIATLIPMARRQDSGSEGTLQRMVSVRLGRAAAPKSMAFDVAWDRAMEYSGPDTTPGRVYHRSQYEQD